MSAGLVFISFDDDILKRELYFCLHKIEISETSLFNAKLWLRLVLVS